MTQVFQVHLLQTGKVGGVSALTLQQPKCSKKAKEIFIIQTIKTKKRIEVEPGQVPLIQDMFLPCGSDQVTLSDGVVVSTHLESNAVYVKQIVPHWDASFFRVL